MSEEFGPDFITVTDEDGQEFELELLDVLEKDDTIYHAFIPAGAGEEEEVDIILLKAVEENGEEILSTLDSEEELEEIYALFMERLFEDEEE